MKVTYINNMGDDLSVVNAAKVSFGKRSEWEGGSHPDFDKPKHLSKKDQGLIQFLARGCTSGDWDELVGQAEVHGYNIFKLNVSGNDAALETEESMLVDLLNHIRKMPSHWSPFAHTAITLHLKMPIFVARQIMKHTTGIEYNEVSRRYVDSEPEFYVPDVWRKKADNVKQGSSDEAVDLRAFGISGDGPPHESGWEADLEEVLGYFWRDTLELYKSMSRAGVAPEQARMILPQSMYTEVIATGNLYAWANMYIQRTDSHAQKETQDLAKQIGEIIQPLYPVSWAALVD